MIGRSPQDGGKFNVSAAAIKHKQLTIFFILAIAIAGFAAYFKLGQREDPDFTFRAITVRTLWPGATTAQVDSQITDRLEKKLQEMPYFKRTQSYSKPGESMIILELIDTAPRKDSQARWYQVRKKVGDIRHTLQLASARASSGQDCHSIDQRREIARQVRRIGLACEFTLTHRTLEASPDRRLAATTPGGEVVAYRPSF